uniref:mitogen-activated protein kinase kinase n=1 Tax=Acrobeloides nanus TaxID=290746 RepID=A0A914D5N2_9BILA
MHRDIKPRNILMDFKGNVKLSDLGLVTFLENSVGISVKSGTKLYCSPEVLDGGVVLKYRVKSDVWSLGITMMEIAFFKFPYVSILEKDFIDEVCDGPAPIMSHDDDYSEEMKEFVNQCLIKEPEARSHIRDLAKTKLAIQFQDLNKTRDYMMKFIQNYTDDIP